MGPKTLTRRLSAILSADVEGYSRLMRDDEEATVRTITTHRNAMTHIIQQYRGRVVDSPGDNILAEFSSVVDAVNCGVEIQRELAERNEELPENRRMQFRIGINLGDVLEEGDRIYGDGVNIAARMESLAEAGGICISGTVYDAIENKIGLEYEYLGEHEVKNIDKPIRAYRVLSFPGAAAHRVVRAKRIVGRTWRKSLITLICLLILIAVAGIWHFYPRSRKLVEPTDVRKMAYPLPDKPSIAVLPFVNMGGDPDQEYFADGITEDLITDLSQMSGLFVIARNSTFVYKGRPTKISRVAEDLGVRYVLEGSVRKSGEKVRINAQLIDATTGGHVWAKRYDGTLDNVFGLQDNITHKIVAALAVKLLANEKEKIARNETDNIEAYDAFLKGWAHYRRWTPKDFREAIPYFERAIELDPNYGRAYAALASIYLETWERQWDWPGALGILGLGSHGCFMRAETYLKEAMKNPTSLAHEVASKRYIHMLYHEKAIDEAERAIALDPNDADGYAAMAEALIYAGRPEEAVDYIKKAMRLDPNNLANYLYTLGVAHFGMEQFKKAAACLERAFKLNPKMGSLKRAYLAVAYLNLGQKEKAKAELNKPGISEVKEIYDYWVRSRARYKNPEDRARLTDGLSELGVK